MTESTLEGVDVTNDNLKGAIVTHCVDNEKYDLQILDVPTTYYTDPF